jgi:hypothetical protein
MPAVMINIFSVCVGCIVAFICGWQLALLLLAMLPALIAAGYFEFSLLMGRNVRDTLHMQYAAKVFHTHLCL